MRTTIKSILASILGAVVGCISIPFAFVILLSLGFFLINTIFLIWNAGHPYDYGRLDELLDYYVPILLRILSIAGGVIGALAGYSGVYMATKTTGE